MMNKNFIDEISKITPSDIIEYLLSNNWIKSRNVGNKACEFRKRYECLDKHDYEEYQLLIPLKNSYSDYKARVMGVVNTLSILEEKNTEIIIKEIQDIKTDVLEVRLINNIFDEGTMPVSLADSVTSFIRNIIVYSACVEENPKPLFNKPTKSSMNYANIFQFGQTKHGSFIMTIESDLNSENSAMYFNKDNEISNEIPFQRKVLRRIQKALYQINTFNGDYDKFVLNSYIDGLNGNMCEAITKLKDLNEKIDIEYRFNMSPIVKEKNDLPKVIKINNDILYKAEILKEKFRELESTEHIKIEAEINRIDYDYESQNKSAYITVNFLYEDDSKYHNARIYVEEEQYDNACDALKERLPVYIEGTLDKRLRRWVITDISVFRIKVE
ncbi:MULTISPECIES: hypothetical protein [unclassified Clostridium]|uniref:hypothetical protein n=1 Tax=unclassified Clostridium TaxID=2614128 RepID=UPI0005FAD76F|nr:MULTISPECIES: hypothetical protein [unclassified Clostridium]